jgi:hypothetical protein
MTKQKVTKKPTTVVATESYSIIKIIFTSLLQMKKTTRSFKKKSIKKKSIKKRKTTVTNRKEINYILENGAEVAVRKFTKNYVWGNVKAKFSIKNIPDGGPNEEKFIKIIKKNIKKGTNKQRIKGLANLF